MPEKDQDQQHLAEAERLALLPLAYQREIIALHRGVAGNPKVPKAAGWHALKGRA